jgi:hypothetical protein
MDYCRADKMQHMDQYKGAAIETGLFRLYIMDAFSRDDYISK